jgi:hypothetical protein
MSIALILIESLWCRTMTNNRPPIGVARGSHPFGGGHFISSSFLKKKGFIYLFFNIFFFY